LDILTIGNPAHKDLFEHLDNQIKLYIAFHLSMDGVSKAIEEISDGETLSAARSDLESIEEFKKELESVRDSIKDPLDSGDTPIKLVQLAMSIYYAVIIGCSSITVLGSILLALCKCNEWRCVSNLGCLILTFLMILGFLLTAVLMPVSVVLIELCDVIELKNLKEDPSIIGEEAWNELKICLDGDGNIYREKGLENSIEFAKDGEEGLTLIRELHDKDAEPCQVKYNYTEAMIKELDKIIDENPQKAAPNAFGTNSPSILNRQCGDQIVWNGDDCTLEKITPGNRGQEGALCFHIASLSTTCGDYITNRYRPKCESFADNLEKLCNYHVRLKTVLGELKTEIERYTPSAFLVTSSIPFEAVMDEENYYLGICKIMEVMGGASATVAVLDNAISNLGGELEDDLNCEFLKDSFNRVHIAICGSLIQNFTSIAFFLGIISAITFISMAFLICVNRRFYVQKGPSKKEL